MIWDIIVNKKDPTDLPSSSDAANTFRKESEHYSITSRLVSFWLLRSFSLTGVAVSCSLAVS